MIKKIAVIKNLSNLFNQRFRQSY